MRAELHIARRYLIGIRRRTHVATVTLISLAGLAMGVFALVVTLALLEGFQSGIREELVERATHARVTSAEGRRLRSPQRVVSVLQAQLGDVQMVEVVRGTCLVVSFVDAVPASVVGRSDTSAAAIDRILSARTGAGRGDVIQVVSARQRLTPMGPLPIRLAVEVTQVTAPEPESESGTVLLPLSAAQRLLWAGPAVQAIELRDPADPWRLGERVRRALADDASGLHVEGLEQLHRSLLLALALERVMIFVAVALMLVVAALNLLCNVAMVAAEKRKDLAVLAGLGLAPGSIRRLFLVLGLAIGMVGTFSGAVLGVATAVTLDVTEALPLPAGMFIVPAVPFRVQPLALAAVMALALALATAAAWLPARAVARREPAEGLRYE